MSQNDIRRVQTIMFAELQDGPRDLLQMATQVVNDGIQTVVVPAILVNADARDPMHPQSSTTTRCSGNWRDSSRLIQAAHGCAESCTSSC